MNNRKIILQLQGGDEGKAFTHLYKLFPKVEKYIRINSGSTDEAHDIFQEALILLFKKAQTITPESPLLVEGYVINSCKLLWSNEIRKKKVRKNSSAVELAEFEYQDDIQLQIEKETKLTIIDSVLKQLGEKCKSILELFYYQNFSMEKIAKRFGYKTVQTAKAQKYKCMENARKLALDANQNVASGSESVNPRNTNLKNS